ncbi:MAG: hypothetical protein ABIG61_08305 [Planctomycetota bacterium]
MAVLVGIDESGYGPILGPLVVSATVFSVPDSLLRQDLWQILSDSVAKDKKNLSGRLLIADSKKAYSRSTGIGHLRRTVLAVASILGKNVSSASELITMLCPDCMERLRAYPWYQNVQEFPLSSEQGDIPIAAGVLKRNLSAGSMELLAIRTAVLDVGYYNKMVGAVRNKAGVLFTAVSSLVKESFDNFGAEPMQIIIDRQGGRTDYTSLLMRMFPDMSLKVLRQDSTDSSYELYTTARTARVHFVIDADDRFLPVALSSMVSKFTRELLVECINRYFTSQCTHLKPTAGYWKDGSRFIADLKKHIPDVKYDSNLLIRSR